MISRGRVALSMMLSAALVLSACGKNDGSASSNTSSNNSAPSTAAATTAATGSTAAVTATAATTTAPPASVYNVPGSESLSVADVQTIISRAVAEAAALNKPAVISVVDRVGNVLAVYTMAGAPANATIRNAPIASNNTDLEGLVVPAGGAAIAKAITGAYLSSGGNAFSTRTASEIVQQFFPPTASITPGLEGGPLFGVQFSQLPCSDLSQRFVGAAIPSAFIGPKRSPLGLAADPGGFPLYKNGVLVGGVGALEHHRRQGFTRRHPAALQRCHHFDPEIQPRLSAGLFHRRRRRQPVGGERLFRRRHHRRPGLWHRSLGYSQGVAHRVQ
jgi:uncharacterized protein GlcG (DUF336 family)